MAVAGRIASTHPRTSNSRRQLRLFSGHQSGGIAMAYNILMMGASYGSLLASKLLFGGHKITLVCLPAEAELINAEGFRVRMPVKGRKDQIEIDSRKLPGKVRAT